MILVECRYCKKIFEPCCAGIDNNITTFKKMYYFFHCKSYTVVAKNTIKEKPLQIIKSGRVNFIQFAHWKTGCKCKYKG